VSAFREIRGVQQRRKGELRRWFQSSYFDLFTTQDDEGDVQWFQLCYARDTWRERVLEWRRGCGFQHLRVRDDPNPVKKDTGALVLNGPLPYLDVMAALRAAGGLPRETRDFVTEKIREYARPARRFRPPRARTPKWLERMRKAQRLRFLDRREGDR
jgi:hypothetical protein